MINVLDSTVTNTDIALAGLGVTYSFLTINVANHIVPTCGW